MGVSTADSDMLIENGYSVSQRMERNQTSVIDVIVFLSFFLKGWRVSIKKQIQKLIFARFPFAGV